MYGKQTERAIAALSRLAEVWDGGRTRLSSVDIADNRGLPRPMVAKLLTTLSQGGLAVNAVVPKELTDILTAVVILAVAVTSPEVRRLWQGALAQRTAQATRAGAGEEATP